MRKKRAEEGRPDARRACGAWVGGTVVPALCSGGSCARAPALWLCGLSSSKLWRTTRNHREREQALQNERRRMSSSVTDGMADTFNARLADAAEQIAEGATGLTPIPPTHRGDNKFDINTPPPILATPPRLPADEGGSLDSPKLSPSAIIRGSSQAMLVCIPVTLPSPAFPLYGILPSLFMHRPSRLRPPCLRPLRRASACTPGIVCSQTEMAAFLERHPSFAQSLRDRVRLHSACSRHSPPARARSS